MAKAFLAPDGKSIDYYLARYEGKVRNPHYCGDGLLEKAVYRPYVTQHNYADGQKTKGDFIFDKLSDVPKTGGFSDGKLFIGVDRPCYSSLGSLYVVGHKSAIVRMFQEATDSPELFVGTPLRIGVYKWKNILTASIYSVRIAAGAPAKAAGKHDFVDTDVTALLSLAGKRTTIHAAMLAKHVKNIFDGKTG